MNKECEIIRDLLPLYTDEVCSPSSREIVDGHLKDCPDCAAYLEQIRASEAEGRLRAEKALVISNQAKKFKRRTTAVGGIVSTVLMVPILICLIVNLTVGRTLDWFFVAAAGMLVVASLVVVPLTVSEDRLFWTLCAFCVSLAILLAVCALYTRGDWFFVAASASLFGLSVVFLPFAIRAKPLRPWVEGHNKAALVLAVDGILFGNMMNVISLRSKGPGFSIMIAVLIVAALALLVTNVIMKDRSR